MDPEEPQPPPRRKHKFTPKVPPRRKPTRSSATPKIEVSDRADSREEAEAQLLLRRFNESRARRGASGDKKSTVQVAFGPGAQSSSSIRSWGKRNSIEQKDSPVDEEIISTATTKAEGDSFGKIPHHKKEKDAEHWDYHHSYYPTNLPWRRPYSGNPALLNEAEFGDAARNMEYAENSINSASHLGLLEENEEQKMLLFKLPSSLPLVKRSASAKGKKVIGESSSSVKGKEVIEKSSSSNTPSPPKGCSLEQLPAGLMGKLLVYKSGAVKLKLGEALYDVSPGTDCKFAQDFAAINTADKQCCILGEVGERAVVTPDISYLKNSALDLE